MRRSILVSIIVIILLATTFLFLQQWKEAEDTAKRLEGNFMFNNLINLSSNLHSISETLDLYGEDFTDIERELFQYSLKNQKSNLNQIGSYLNHINIGNVDWHRELYQKNIFTIEELIKDIGLGQINKKSKIQEISFILDQYSKELSDLFFIETVGVDGLYDEQVQRRIISIVENTNKKISQLDL